MRKSDYVNPQRHPATQALTYLSKCLRRTERAIRELHRGPVIRVPWDLDLRAQLNSGEYTLDAVRRRSTRLPIKQLAIEVCQRLV